MGHGGAIEDIVNAGKGCQTHGNAPRLPDGGQGIQNLKQQTRPIFCRSAIGIAAGVDPILSELLQQTTIGDMQLNAVKSCLFGVCRGLNAIFDHALNASNRQRLGRRGGFKPAMCATPNVPQLDHDLATRFVYSVRDLAPAGDLIVGIDAGCTEIPFALGADLRGFGHDQPGARTLAVIVDMHVADVARVIIGPVPGQRCHHNAVFKVDLACRKRCK